MGWIVPVLCSGEYAMDWGNSPRVETGEQASFGCRMSSLGMVKRETVLEPAFTVRRYCGRVSMGHSVWLRSVMR